MTEERARNFWRRGVQCLLGSIVLAVLTFICFELHAMPAQASLLYFFFIVLFALWAGFLPSVVISIPAIFFFDYFFAEPRFSLRVDSPMDVIAMITFSGAALIVSRLMSRIRERTAQLEKSNEQLRAEIVERKQAQEAYANAQAELAHVSRVTTMGELAASIAHEVNQPLCGVVINANSCLRWLGANPPDLQEAREAVQRILRDGKRSGDVIARIRALARKSTTTKERLNLNQVVEEVIGLSQDELRRKHVKLRTELAPDLAPATGDRVQIQQVLLNLIMNGVDAMSGAGEESRVLVIKTQREKPDQVGVAVRDSGIGFKPETTQKLFEAFYSTKPAGMGMGLSISRSIIENHGGRIWAAPNDGPGATFQFTIPQYQ